MCYTDCSIVMDVLLFTIILYSGTIVVDTLYLSGTESPLTGH